MTNTNNKTPFNTLEGLISTTNWDDIKSLLDDIDAAGRARALTLASYHNNFEIVKKLITHYNINPDHENKWALSMAIHYGNLNFIKFLKESGFDIFKNGDSLLGSVKSHHPEITEYLLDQGADVNSKTKEWLYALPIYLSNHSTASFLQKIDKVFRHDLIWDSAESKIDYIAFIAEYDYLNAAKFIKPYFEHDTEYDFLKEIFRYGKGQTKQWAKSLIEAEIIAKSIEQPKLANTIKKSKL